jgi:hypothetical protein
MALLARDVAPAGARASCTAALGPGRQGLRCHMLGVKGVGHALTLAPCRPRATNHALTPGPCRERHRRAACPRVPRCCPDPLPQLCFALKGSHRRHL